MSHHGDSHQKRQKGKHLCAHTHIQITETLNATNTTLRKINSYKIVFYLFRDEVVHMILIYLLFLHSRLPKREISHLAVCFLPFSWSFKTSDFLAFLCHGESPIPYPFCYKKSFNHWNASTSTSKSPEPIYQFLSHLNMSLVDLYHRDASLKFWCDL